MWSTIAQHIAEVTETSCAVQLVKPVAGGCINSAYRLKGGNKDYFVKVNASAGPAMFEAEAVGLQELSDTNTVKVPRPICWGQVKGSVYLVLEYWPLKPITAEGLVSLGGQLAALHRIAQPHFGWHRNNTIGATPQYNTPSQNWLEFWRQHRLGFQLQLAATKGYGGALQRKGERLMAQAGALFVGYTPTACLLHGDLWGGNVASNTAGDPLMFDPATYYGDRETDIAMTELFGGFGPDFYTAYHAVYPLPDGYQVRRIFYNLYHILNHLNLFGGSYLAQAERLMDQVLLAIRRH